MWVLGTLRGLSASWACCRILGVAPSASCPRRASDQAGSHVLGLSFPSCPTLGLCSAGSLQATPYLPAWPGNLRFELWDSAAPSGGQHGHLAWPRYRKEGVSREAGEVGFLLGPGGHAEGRPAMTVPGAARTCVGPAQGHSPRAAPQWETFPVPGTPGSPPSSPGTATSGPDALSLRGDSCGSCPGLVMTALPRRLT